jgi:hypothetical protein
MGVILLWNVGRLLLQKRPKPRDPVPARDRPITAGSETIAIVPWRHIRARPGCERKRFQNRHYPVARTSGDKAE